MSTKNLLVVVCLIALALSMTACGSGGYDGKINQDYGGQVGVTVNDAYNQIMDSAGVERCQQTICP